MEISILLAQEIFKLFAMMLMGYGIVKAGLLRPSDGKSISVVMVYLVVPCTILSSFQVDYTPEVASGLFLAFVAATAVHILFLALTALLRPILHLDIIERVTVIYSNGGILVIPPVQGLLGPEYVIYTSAFMTVQIVLIWTHCRMVFCSQERFDWKKILLNVNIIAVFIGIVMFCMHLRFPYIVQDTVDRMSNMLGPLGMLLAGMAIAERPIRTVFTRWRNYLPTVLRLFGYPAVVLLLMKVLFTISSVADAKNILLTVYIASVAPACATVTSLAQLYDQNPAYSSSLYVLTTLLSIATMPIMVGLYETLI